MRTPAVIALVVGGAAVAAADPAPLPERPKPPEVPEELRARARAALLDGRLDDAEQLLGAALAERSDEISQAPLWHDLCLVRYAAGAYGDAINACYRALADRDYEPYVEDALARIGDAIAASDLSLDGIVLPDPQTQWRNPRAQIHDAMVVDPLESAAGAVRDLRAPSLEANLRDPLSADEADRLRGPARRLRGRVERLTPRSLGGGLGLDLKLGSLTYAPDTKPGVGGVRIDYRRLDLDGGWHGHAFAEYLHAFDGTGGIGAAGYGWEEEIFGVELAASLPWGKHGTDTVAGMHAEARGAFRFELVWWTERRAVFEVWFAVGVDAGKALLLVDDDRAPAAHTMLGISVGGRRNTAMHPHSFRSPPDVLVLEGR
jgi:hypothetical protein